MGIGGAGGAGVLHTSGNTMLIPPLPLWAIPRELTNVVWPTLVTFHHRSFNNSPIRLTHHRALEIREPRSHVPANDPSDAGGRGSLRSPPPTGKSKHRLA